MEMIRLRATETPFKEREDTLRYAGLNWYSNSTQVLGTSKYAALDSSAWHPHREKAYIVVFGSTLSVA